MFSCVFVHRWKYPSGQINHTIFSMRTQYHKALWKSWRSIAVWSSTFQNRVCYLQWILLIPLLERNGRLDKKIRNFRNFTSPYFLLFKLSDSTSHSAMRTIITITLSNIACPLYCLRASVNCFLLFLIFLIQIHCIPLHAIASIGPEDPRSSQTRIINPTSFLASMGEVLLHMQKGPNG